MPRHRQRRRIRLHAPQEQFSLPLDYSQSEHVYFSQNLAQSKAIHSRRGRVRPVTNRATLWLRGIVEASYIGDSDISYFRQVQRFMLTPTISVLIGEVNENRWPRNVAALPPLSKGADAQSGKGRAPF